MKRYLQCLLAGLMVLTLGSCSQDAQVEHLKILAGSELKDLKPMLNDIREKTGIQLDFEYIGTLDGAEKLTQEPGQYDLAWFSHAKYLSILQGQNKVILAQEKIGISPVIPAIKKSLADQWGWSKNQSVSWAQIAAKVAAGELRYAMSDPTASNSGFSTVMGVQAAFSGSSDVITAKDVDAEKLKTFFSGQKLISGSSGWLAEAYIRDQASLDGLFNYESVLLSLNNDSRLNEKVVLIYPKEGVVTADYPLMLMNNEKRPQYQKLVEYFKSTPFQSWMMQHTNRRPVIAQVKPDSQFPKSLLLELPFPNNIQTINEILFSYLDKYRRPSHSFFVLDVSGSMGTEHRIENLKRALLNLTGDDKSISGQFARFRNREKVTIITFNNIISDVQEFTIDHASGQIQSSQSLRNYVKQLSVGGGTAVFTALGKAYDLAAEAKKNEPERFYSIVLMSDGDSNAGWSLQDFEQFYREHSDEVATIRTFPVLFGDSNDRQMQQLATRTGGKVFDSRKHSLSFVFKKIRGYQ